MSYRSTILADTPTAYWRLGEAAGVNAADETGNGHTGTYENAPTLGATGLLTGDADTAVTLNGTTQDVLIASVPGLATSTSTISLEAWFKTTAAAGTIIGCRNSVSGNQVMTLGISGGQLLIQVRDNNNVGLLSFVTTDVVVNDGVRHHIVATRDSSKVWRVYLDGVLVLVKSDTMTSACNALDWAYIGRERRNAVFFNGTIDEVAIYNSTVLTAAQVRDHYTAGSAEATTGAADFYSAAILVDTPSIFLRLGEASGIRAADSSGNGTHGARRNGAGVNNTGLLPNSADPASLLDGTNDRIDLPTLTPLATSTGEFSVEAWVKTSVAVIKAIYGGRQWASGIPVLDISITAAGLVNVQVRGDNNVPSGTTNLTGVKAVNDGNAHHVVVTRDTSKNLRIYIDGVLDKGPTADGLTAGITGLDQNAIGVERTNATFGAWNGTIDEFAFYPVALSAGQVANHFNAGNTASLTFIPTATVVYAPTIPVVPMPFIGSTTVVHAPVLVGVLAPPFIGSVTVVYPPTLSAPELDVPFISSATTVFAPTLIGPVDLPFIASRTRVYGVFSLFRDTTAIGIPGNGGESFPVELAPNGTSIIATLATALTATSTLLVLTGDAGMPDAFVVTIDTETMYVVKIAAGSYRIRRRGTGNTTVAGHTAGADVTWTDSYDQAIIAAADIAHSFTADITSSGSFTYPGWLICIDSTQAYLAADRYPMHITEVIGVFDAGAGATGLSRCDAAQPNAIATAAAVSDNCPAALSNPARISTDIAAGDVAVLRYTNPEASILELGARSAALQSWFGLKRVDALDVDVTLTDPTGYVVDTNPGTGPFTGSVNGEWDDPLGPGIGPDTGEPTNHDVPYTSVTLPHADRNFTIADEKGWPICALAVRQGTHRVPLWRSWDWHNFVYIYSGFDIDATFCQLLINRNGIIFGSVPEVDLPGSQDIDGPDAVWDQGADGLGGYYFGASWYVAIFSGPYLVAGPTIGGGGGGGGGPAGGGVVPIVTFGPGGGIDVPPFVEGGEGGGISPPTISRFHATVV